MPVVRSLSRRARLVACVAMSAAVGVPLLVTLTASGARAAQPAGPYVALGDSYTSGPGIPTQDPNSGRCRRSDHNYPSLVALALKSTSFKDVSCSGAVTDNMANARGEIPPQFTALSPDTRLVTVGIGGNDVGFLPVALTCIRLGPTDPNGSPCKNQFTAGGTDQITQMMQQVVPNVTHVLQGVHLASPLARVMLVGYPAVLPDSKAKCAVDPVVAAGDVPYLRATIQRFNGMLKQVAAANGADFVDTFASSTGHEACLAPGTRFLEGVNDVQGASALHPNALGMANTAAQVLATLRK